MITLGIYAAGESKPPPDPRMLASAGCNAVWLTHCLDPTALSVPATLEYARRCASAGLRLVAAPSALHISGPTMGWKRTQEYYDRVITATIMDWTPAPPPLAWSLGDEPTELDAYREYVATWRRLAPAERLTTVVTRPNVAPFRALEFDVIAHDVYPFFEPAGGGYPDGPIAAWLTTCSANAGGWAMGQGFGKPGVWRIPTPAEVSWQVYSALACGCRGVFMFCWATDIGPERLTNLAQLPAQFAAMSMAYRRAATWSVLETAKPSIQYRQLPGPPGSGYGMFTGQDGSRYVLAVCGPAAGATLSVPTPGWTATDVETGRWVLTLRGVISAKLAAGEGRLWRIR